MNGLWMTYRGGLVGATRGRGGSATAGRGFAGWVLVVVLVVGVGWAEASVGGSVTLRSEAEVVGPTVTVADVARLQGEYAQSLGEIEVGEFGENQHTLRIAMQQIRRKLDERQVHWGRLVCRGARQVTVRRIEPPTETEADEADAPVVTLPEANPLGIVSVRDSEATAGRTLRKRLHRWIEQQVEGGPDAEVAIRFDESDGPLLDAPLGAQRIEFEPLSSQPIGRLPVTVRRYDGGDRIATDRVRVEVELTQPAVVARRSLGRGRVIAERDLQVKPVTRTSLRKQPLRDKASAVGRQSVGLIREGAVVHVDDVRAPVLVRRGQSVTVRAVSGGVVLRMVGRAMEDGERGETIKLRNERTREQFKARVTGPQEALMMLDDEEALAGRETP